MDDDDFPVRSPSRPPLSISRASRRVVPGSFDDGEISPVKQEQMDFPSTGDSDAAATNKTNPLNANAIPALPPPTSTIPHSTGLLSTAVGESSFADGPSMLDGPSHVESMTDQAVRAHLQDIESSFIPPLSPPPIGLGTGVDDTYLFDGTRPQQSTLASVPHPQLPSQPRTSSPLKPTAPSHVPTATPDGDRLPPPSTKPPSANPSSDDVSNTTSELENLSSSPTAAAAARTVSKVLSSTNWSAASASQNTDATGFSDSADTSQDDLRQSIETDDGADAGSTPGFALRTNRRPRYLRSRNVSQRSSLSSIGASDLHDDGDSDVTVGLGTDYQPGGAGGHPLGSTRSLSSILRRSISMGSVASGIDDLHDGPRGFEHLETLDENPNSPLPRGGSTLDDPLKTPKAAKKSMNAPTDTVIARHVRNVQVPESLAKEYKFRSGLATPRRPSEVSVPGSARTGKNLTLKEQSSTIERLSKENFDLKLKVMFLSDRLDKVSEEGVKEMISENVELKTSLAVVQRENKTLRRRVKELEKQLRDEDVRPGTAVSSTDQNSPTAEDAAAAAAAREREDEIFYLHERIEEYVVEVERLKNEAINREVEKRRLADVVRSMGERSTGETLGRQEETDVWKDLLEQETARREQADEDNRKLHDEVFRLKQELANGAGGLHHTTNIYNITKKPRVTSPSRPTSRLSGEAPETANGSYSATSTLVEELRRESDHLRHENAELRREVGAQTSMLTSRNREKERLYQEIEDLKMAQRRGGAGAPSVVDSLLDRSASRAGGHQRSQSRTSAGTRLAMPDDSAEREELENKITDLRDKMNETKLRNQELQRELDTCMEDFETAVQGKRQAEELALGLQEDLETAMNDLVALQAERDEALREQADMENEFEALRKEAQEEIDALESEADQRGEEMQRLQLDLNDRTENFDALQEEMRGMSDALLRLEDEQDNKLRRVQQLEQELAEANKELEELEAKLLEANDKANRLGVQQESSQGEIAFLREEQETDKIRIGDLEAALANAEQNLRDERERVKELDQRLASERRQREIVANREKEEVQQFVNELNREASTAKDEARRLRKNLTSREVEATEWKERLMELENNLREALGDLNGTRSSLLKSIAKLQQQLEDTVRELETSKALLVEKDNIIKQRDALLESHALESRKIGDLLEKERQAHRNTRNQFETFQKTHHHVALTVSTQEERISELEGTRSQDKKRIAQLEVTFREQLTERNNLLLVLWSRLSSLCGSDWAHDHSLINGRALPSLEAVATMLPGFSKNLLAAVQTIESMVGGFQSRIKGVERDVWREYQTLENNLDMRIRRLDRLEGMVRNGVVTGTLGTHETQSRMARLEEAYRQLKVENATLRTAHDVRVRAAASAAAAAAVAATGGNGGNGGGGDSNHLLLTDVISGSPSPSIPTGPRDRDRSRRAVSRTTTMTRPMTSSAIPVATTSSAVATTDSGELSDKGGSGAHSQNDNRWMLRLRDLEYKLKMEREGRNQDRNAARQRLGGLESENRDLRGEVARIKKEE